MDAIIDTGAFIWDRKKFNDNDVRHYALTLLLVDFMQTIEVEQPRILLRGALKEEMFNFFPWDGTGIPNFFELTRSVSAFLSNTEVVTFDVPETVDAISSPDIIYSYYNENIKTEIKYLIQKLHNDISEVVYFTFCPIWSNNSQLTTKREKDDNREHTTIIHCKEELQNYFAGLKFRFVHNPKHDRLLNRKDIERGFRWMGSEKVFPFSAYYDADPKWAQRLLDSAISHPLKPKNLYYFDSHNNTFVCYKNTTGRIYHAHDIPTGELPEPIQQAVMKKLHEQN